MVEQRHVTSVIRADVLVIMQGNVRMDEAILALIVKAETKTNVNLAVSELMRETEFIFVAHSGAKPMTVCWIRAVT